MSKRTLLSLGAILLSAFLVSGCSFGKNSPNGAEKSNEMIGTPPGTLSAADQAAYTAAVLSGSPEQCAQIKDTTQQEKCRNEIAFQEAAKNRDVEACAKISEAAARENCEDNLAFNEAGEKHDESICLKIKNVDQKKLCQ